MTSCKAYDRLVKLAESLIGVASVADWTGIGSDVWDALVSVLDAVDDILDVEAIARDGCSDEVWASMHPEDRDISRERGWEILDLLRKRGWDRS